jgi:hypothetical protein
MRKLLPMFVIFSVAATPALAQQAPADPAQASAPQVKMVTKVVCQRVDVEATSGSRLSSRPKICKKVTVPADDKEARNAPRQPSSPEGH